MGIIISSFVGCGRRFLKNTHGDKMKVFDAVERFPITDNNDISNDFLDEYYNTVMEEVNKNDIVFIDSDENVRNVFDEHHVDYDVFYPSSERRGEFIENQVIKRTKPQMIRWLDSNFDKLVRLIDDEDSPNCYKHKLSNRGEFIGNSPIIMQYIDSLKKTDNTEEPNSTNG